MPPSGKSASSRSGGARMREVADRAGVSRMTVSRALNQPEKVKETLRQRVLESVEALGYVHNHLARSLSSRRSNVVGLVLPSLENSIFAQTLKGISDILRPQGYHLMVAESSDDTEEEERVIAAFLAQRVGGLILIRHSYPRSDPAAQGRGHSGGRKWRLALKSGGYGRQLLQPERRQGDDAASLAARVPEDCLRRPLPTIRARRNASAGFVEALTEVGNAPDPNQMVAVSRGFGGGAEVIGYISQNFPDADAVFCAGDVLAAGALLECIRRGWPGSAKAGDRELRRSGSFAPSDANGHLIAACPLRNRADVARKCCSPGCRIAKCRSAPWI